MTRRALLAVAACLALAVPALAEAPEVTFPLGPWVRAGRPVVVRVPGARRVRASDSPWALPQGVRGDEFLLQIPRADLSLRTLEVDDGAAVRTVDVAVEPLRDGTAPVTAVFAPRAAAGLGVVVPTEALPTVAEAWLLFDEVDEAPAGISSDARAALAAWRDGPRATERVGFAPILHAPDPRAFRAAAEVAASAAPLPPGPVRLLVLTGAVTLFLLATTRRRRPLARAVWVGGPAVLAGAWLVASGALPGPVRGTILWVQDQTPVDRLVLLRLDAPLGGDVSFDVPSDAGTPVLLRYDADDRTGLDAEIGRSVRISIPAGQSRLLAWRLPAGTEPTDPWGDPDESGPPAGPALRAWLDAAGFRFVAVFGDPDPEPAPLLRARGFAPVAVRAVLADSE